jgi:hypothetical protein
MLGRCAGREFRGLAGSGTGWHRFAAASKRGEWKNGTEWRSRSGATFFTRCMFEL